VQHEYERNMLDGGFTCCVGSSMESHALHGDGLYYAAGGDKLWVNLYVPSTAAWDAAGVQLTMETDFPEGQSATLRLAVNAPRPCTIALRRPFWVGAGFAVAVNGQALPPEQLAAPVGGSDATPGISSYVELRRIWNDGDTITLALPKTLRLQPLADNPRRSAILWGPLVLAGDLGADNRPPPEHVPVLVGAERPVNEWLQPVTGHPGNFRTAGVGRDADVDFSPFYRLHRRTYAIYWDLFTPEEWRQRSVEIAAQQARQRRLEAATIGFVQPGQMQAERDANMQGVATEPVRVQSRPGRSGTQWFSFDIAVDPSHPLALVVTYNRDEWQVRKFEVLVDALCVGQQTLERRGPQQFFDVEYPVPAATVQGKQKVTVKFQAATGSDIGAVYGLRMIRTDAAR